LNEVHRKISIGGAPQPSRARAARVFVYPVARIPQKWISVLRKEYAPFKTSSIFARQTGNATLPENARCADLALVYGKGGGLSPFRRVFWAILAMP
jgi:hypothetical protein